MEKNKQTPDTTCQGGQPILVPYAAQPQKYIVCDMCGHKNPEYTALCEQCSNYLKN